MESPCATTHTKHTRITSLNFRSEATCVGTHKLGALGFLKNKKKPQHTFQYLLSQQQGMKTVVTACEHSICKRTCALQRLLHKQDGSPIGRSPQPTCSHISSNLPSSKGDAQGLGLHTQKIHC